MSGSAGAGVLDRQIGEGLIVAPPDRLPPRVVRVHAAQLMDAESSLDIHHVVLEAGIDDLVVLESLVRIPLPRTPAQPVEPLALDRRRAHSSFGVVTMPPSPVTRFFVT